jgi:DNA phosphorothioation-dependent restriction protein DptH
MPWASGGGTAAREADAFSIPAETHLHPKLRLGVRATKDFRISPETHAAHLSLLFDVFPAEEVAARKADPRLRPRPRAGVLDRVP